MNKEKLFELAVSLVAANLSAGQFNNSMNFATIVYEDTEIAYEKLSQLWKDIAEESESTEGSSDDGSGGSLTH